jgi:proline iminopeptidase
MTGRRLLYPPIEPFATHGFDVGDGHRLYVEEVGRPDGIPAVFLHGGPGGGLVPMNRRFFDPERYRVVLIDQRGCGRSTPLGSLHANTTGHLVADLELVREALGLDSWLVFGGSWGSALALAYAQAHPGCVTGLVLRGIFLVRSSERRWFYQDGARHLRPAEWERFAAPIPEDERADLVGAYHRRLLGPDAGSFARPWMRWEAVNSALTADPAFVDLLTGDDVALTAARILTHYLVNDGFFESETQLLDGVERIRHLPAVIVQGAYDLCCPPVTAHELAARWPEADLHLIPDAGHASTEPGITDRLIRATDGFAATLTE